MLEKTSSPKRPALSEQRQVKALLSLIQDLGYEVDTGPAGQWTVSEKDDRGQRRVLGVDSASKVAAVARELADSLQIDRQLVRGRVLTH